MKSVQSLLKRTVTVAPRLSVYTGRPVSVTHFAMALSMEGQIDFPWRHWEMGLVLVR